MQLKWQAMLAVTCIPLIGCGQGSGDGAKHSSSGDWKLTSASDPMSGLRGLAAQSVQRTEDGAAEIKIACIGRKSLSYQLVLQSDQGPAIIAWPSVSDPTLQARIDGEEAMPVKVKQPRPFNTLLLRDENIGSTLKTAGHLGNAYWHHLNGSLSDFAVMQFALAKSLRLKVALTSGDAVVVIDQTVPAIRSVLDKCGVDPAKIKQAAEEQAARNQKQMDDYRNYAAAEYGPQPAQAQSTDTDADSPNSATNEN